MSIEEDNRVKLQSFISLLSKRGCNVKLKEMECYINNKFEDANCKLNAKEDLLNYSSLNFNEEDFEQFMYIVNERYSIGNPYYIYKFKFLENKNLSALNDRFQSIINESTKYDTAECLLFDFEISCITSDRLQITLKFNKYPTRRNMNLEATRSSDCPESYGKIQINFIINRGLILIKIGDYKICKFVIDFIKYHLRDIIFTEEVKISENTIINYTGPSDAKKITIFMLELVTNHLQDCNHLIISHTKVGFSNPLAERINSLKVAGNNLFQDDSVVDQVANMASLKMVELQMIIEYPDKTFIRVTFSIIPETTIKIVISEIDNPAYTLDIVAYIYDKINNLLNTHIQIISPSVLSHYFTNILSRRKMRENLIYDNVKESLIKNPTLSPNKDIIIDIIDHLKE